MFGSVQKVFALIFLEILVMTRQKSHVFESEKVARYTFLV